MCVGAMPRHNVPSEAPVGTVTDAGIRSAPRASMMVHVLGVPVTPEARLAT